MILMPSWNAYLRSGWMSGWMPSWNTYLMPSRMPSWNAYLMPRFVSDIMPRFVSGIMSGTPASGIMPRLDAEIGCRV